MQDSLAIKTPSRPENLSVRAKSAVGTPVPQAAEGNNAALALVLMRNLTESIYLISAEGRVIFANGPGLARLGQAGGHGAGSQATHRHWQEFWPEADRKSLAKAFVAALDGDTSRMRVISRDDQRMAVFCDLTIAPVDDSLGAISRVICIARSIAQPPEYCAIPEN